MNIEIVNMYFSPSLPLDSFRMILFEKLKSLWENVEGIVSYVYMLGSSLVAIGLSLVVLFMRTTLSRVMNLDSGYLGGEEEFVETEKERKGRKINIYYGTQTGTAKVRFTKFANFCNDMRLSIG
jgi:hypothetical protein